MSATISGGRMFKIEESDGKSPSKFQKDGKLLCTCQIYHEVLDESVCENIHNEILEDVIDNTRKDSCTKGNYF